MIRKLTTGEREAIASALYKLANERQKEADAILSGAGSFQTESGVEPDEQSNAKFERLAGTIIGRYKALKNTASRYGNLGDFLTNTRHTVTVDCIINIAEQF